MNDIISELSEHKSADAMLLTTQPNHACNRIEYIQARPKADNSPQASSNKQLTETKSLHALGVRMDTSNATKQSLYTCNVH